MVAAGRLLLLWCWPALAAGAYTLKPQVVVHGPWITAGDILEPAPEGRLASVRIRRLGPPGSTVQVTRDLVWVRVREARLSELPEIKGGPCQITASQRLVVGADVAAFGERYLRERLSGTGEVEIRLAVPARDMKVPDRPVRFEIRNRPSQALRGSVMLRVALMQTPEDGSELEVGQALVGFHVSLRRPALKAKRAIARGEALDPENTSVEPAEIGPGREEPYAELSAAEGLKARSPIAQGRLIYPSMLERPKVVRRGDLLRLNVRAGLVSVEVQAKALRDAAEGDSIPLEVIGTKKQVQAVVLDARTALVEP